MMNYPPHPQKPLSTHTKMRVERVGLKVINGNRRLQKSFPAWLQGPVLKYGTWCISLEHIRKNVVVAHFTLSHT